ncbi:MAG TPA: proteasome assembly chaperone family protein [Acidilobales archaeon]|nr:proteasome assembly chaperone family protein [Acidilobales archaeon]
MSYFREEFWGDFLFAEYEDFRLKSPGYAIIAVPDAGLVGVIGASHIIKALGMREVGGIDSYIHLPPIAVISRKEVRLPVRIFYRDNLLLIYSEFIPPMHALPQLVRALVHYVERKGAEYLVLMSGIPIPNRFEVDKLRTYYIATTPKALELVKGVDIIPFENGYLVGPYALLLKESVRLRFNSIILLTESFMEFPDPEASARNIQIFSKITGLKIDVKELLEQAEIIRLKARDTMKNVVHNLAQMRKEYEYAVPLHI